MPLTSKDLFLKDRPLKADRLVTIGFGGGLGGLGGTISLGKVGANAPCARRCFVEMPLATGISDGAMLAILPCGLVERRPGLLGGLLSLVFAVSLGFFATIVSETGVSENREFGDPGSGDDGISWKMAEDEITI